MAKVAIIGAGVVGTASAYMLCKAGLDVTLIDRNPGPAQGASRANGAQLSYAYGDALASPSFLAHMPEILLKRDPAYRVRLQADPEFLIWGLRFLFNSLQSRFIANTRYLLQMAAETSDLLGDVLREFDLSFDYQSSGKMILYSTAAACQATAGTRRLKQSMGIRQEVLDRSGATAIEPALAHYPDEIARVIYSEGDAAGRPDVFCTTFIERLRERYGLKTIFGEEVEKILSHAGRVSGLAFRSREPLACDLAVVASGYSMELLPWRDRLPGALWPVQGYSISAPATEKAMRVSITDLQRKIVFARLGNTVRAAGLADIGARPYHFNGERFESFRSAAVEAFGQSFAHSSNADLNAWSGVRPCTPSSRPLIRPGSLKGLYLNLGHGTLGWTLCLGSAKRLATVIKETK